jgi:cation diffusion facilitator family transporter
MCETAKDRSGKVLMRISLFSGFLMLFLKVGAYYLTGSAALVSDAAETIVHVFACSFAFFSYKYSLLPPDKEHPYGHARIQFFSAGMEGFLIAVAGVTAIAISIFKWASGSVPQELSSGIFLTSITIILNFALGTVLSYKGRKIPNLILEANGKHLLTDCWTSLGAIFALILVCYTGKSYWDPAFGILIGLNIVFAGYKLIRRSVNGLMDAIEPETEDKIHEFMQIETGVKGITYHALTFRDIGNAYRMEVHLQFEDEMPLKDAHQIATDLENNIRNLLDRPIYVTTHLEPKKIHDKIHKKQNRY